MVAVRSTGLAFDAIIGFQEEDGTNMSIVDEAYLRSLVGIANDRFRVNAERIERFRSALLGKEQVSEWEDAEARRRRKREEGLQRQRAAQAEKSMPSEHTAKQEADTELNGVFG